MTNLQKFFNASSGTIFIFVFAICIATIPAVRVDVAKAAAPLFTDPAQLLSALGLMIVILGFGSVALSLLVGRLWDAFFYFFGGGYDQQEYEPVRKALLSEVTDESDASKFLKKLNIQPLYGTILHSFAPTSYIEWLGRRWTSFNNAGLQATSEILAVMSVYGFSALFDFSWPNYLLSFVFGILFPAVTIYVGLARLKEVLAAEDFFCRSLGDEDLRKAVQSISAILSKRGGSTDGVAELTPRL